MAKQHRRQAIVIGVAAGLVALVAAVIWTGQGDSRQQVGATTNSASPSSAPTTSSASSSPSSTTLSSSTSASSALQVANSSNSSSSSAGSGSTEIGDAFSTDQAPLVHDIVAVALSPAAPVAGDLVKVSITVTNFRSDDSLALARDKAFVEYWTSPPGAISPVNCSHDPVRHDRTFVFDTAFKLPGLHELTAVLVSDGCLDSPDPTVRVPVNIDVAGPLGPSNGPFLPSFAFAQQADAPAWADQDPALLYAYLDMSDRDGALDQFITVDWGDGTPVDHVDVTQAGYVKGNECDPNSEYQGSESGRYPAHHYLAAGTYAVTVTLNSSGCSGAAPHQTATTTFSVTRS